MRKTKKQYCENSAAFFMPILKLFEFNFLFIPLIKKLFILFYLAKKTKIVQQISTKHKKCTKN